MTTNQPNTSHCSSPPQQLTTSELSIATFHLGLSLSLPNRHIIEKLNFQQSASNQPAITKIRNSTTCITKCNTIDPVSNIAASNSVLYLHNSTNHLKSFLSDLPFSYINRQSHKDLNLAMKLIYRLIIILTSWNIDRFNLQILKQQITSFIISILQQSFNYVSYLHCSNTSTKASITAI